MKHRSVRRSRLNRGSSAKPSPVINRGRSRTLGNAVLYRVIGQRGWRFRSFAWWWFHARPPIPLRPIASASTLVHHGAEPRMASNFRGTVWILVALWKQNLCNSGILLTMFQSEANLSFLPCFRTGRCGSFGMGTWRKYKGFTG